MYLRPQEWLTIIGEEYLRDFVGHGGAAVKCVAAIDDAAREEVLAGLRRTAEAQGFVVVAVDAARTRLHMIDQLFHEVARQVDWDELAYTFVSALLSREGYRMPADRAEFSLHRIAALNEREERLLRRDVQGWLEREVFHDYRMSQEFRIAMVRLCMAQLDPDGGDAFLTNAVKEWLRGELRRISTVRTALIYQKIARHNARHMLLSLAHWLTVNGRRGLVLVLDMSRYAVAKRPAEPADGAYYSTPAALDMYEVLRQFIDGTDELESCLVTAVTGREFLDDDRRGLRAYDALRLRISDEIRDRERQNPLAPLVRVSSAAALA